MEMAAAFGTSIENKLQRLDVIMVSYKIPQALIDRSVRSCNIYWF